MIRLRVSLLALAALPGFADLPRPVVENVVPDRYRPIAFDQQRLAGILGDRMRAAREGYLEHANDKAALTSPAELGTFLHAAVIAYEYSHDPNLKAVMDRTARKLLSAHRSRSEELPAGLLGLLAYYRVSGDQAAFNEVKRIGDLLIKTLEKLAPEQNQTASLLQPLVYLYRYTGNTRYLELSRRVAAAILKNGSEGSSLRERLPALTGLLELYRSTGNAGYYTPVLSAWAALRDGPFFFSVNSRSLRNGEHPQLADACTTALWIELTLNLLRLTGRPQYGQALEHIFYNQLFAAQDVKTGNVFSDVPLNGSKKPASSGDPCAPSEAYAISTIPSAVWGRYARGIAVILYSPGRATFRLGRRATIQLYSEAAYPETGEILLHVEPGRNTRFPLRLRVPEWTSKFFVDAAGTHVAGNPGDFLTIDREWQKGDTVKITINITVHPVDGPPSSGTIAIARGPQVLALGKTLNPRISDLSTASLVARDPARLTLIPLDTRLPATWVGNQAYSVSGEYGGKPQQLILVPFADEIDYRVWMPKPPTMPARSDR